MKKVKEDLGKVSITVEKDYWSDERPYERLVIVEVLNVGCYLSRKAVPVGIQYTNREYWIKCGTTDQGGGGGSDVEVVTDFGQSVTKVICQKTITDRFDETDETISGISTRVNTGLGTIETQIAQINNDSLPSIRRDISNHNGRIMELEQFADTAQPELIYLDTESHKHANSIDSINVAIDRLKAADDTIFSNVAELISDVNNLEISVKRAYKPVNVTTKNVLYIGGRVTKENNDTVMLNSLRTQLEKTEGTDFFTVLKDNLSGADLVDLVDGDLASIDGMPPMNKLSIVIVQTDTSSESVGTTSDFTVPMDTSGRYESTVYGQYMYFVDKFREANKNVTILFVAPPNIQHRDTEVGYKPYVIKDVAELSDCLYVNPFKFRYANTWTVTTTIDGSSKVVIGSSGLFVLSLVSYWATCIANKILLAPHFIVTDR